MRITKRCRILTALLSLIPIAQAQHNRVSGMYVLQFPGQNLAPVTNYIMNQPAVRGGNIVIVWSSVDKGGGTYDWSGVDTQIAAWAAIGKPVNLIVWPANYALPQQTGTPSYVTSAAGYQSISCSAFGPVPVWFGDTFKTYYKTFVAAVMSRYGSDPRVGYMRFGLSEGGESYPECVGGLMTAFNWTEAQLNTEWLAYIAEMTSYQASLPHTVQLVTALNQYGTVAQQHAYPLPTGQYAVCDAEAANAVSLGMGFGTQGLQLSDVANYPSPCNSDWCAAFANQTAVPLYLQTYGVSSPAGLPPSGSLTTTLPFALSLGATVFEMFIQDWQVAYDPTSPNYSTYGATYRALFAEIERSLGY